MMYHGIRTTWYMTNLKGFSEPGGGSGAILTRLTRFTLFTRLTLLVGRLVAFLALALIVLGLRLLFSMVLILICFYYDYMIFF